MIIEGDMSNYGHIARQILVHGQVADPRGVRTHEVLNFTLVSKNPRNRLVRDPNRKLKLSFAAAEFVSLLTGRVDVPFFVRHVKGYGKYSSDGVSIDPGTAYGQRLHNHWTQLLQQLQDDPDTREAVLPLYWAEDLKWKRAYTTTSPCTCMFQFFVRCNVLHMTTTMRSNDVYLGLPYDYFCFTMLMEWVAATLGYRLGTYTHNVGSMHVYHSDLSKVYKLQTFPSNAAMPPMSPVPLMAEVEQLGKYLMDQVPTVSNEWINANLISN